jgi:hypothetical protein
MTKVSFSNNPCLFDPFTGVPRVGISFGLVRRGVDDGKTFHLFVIRRAGQHVLEAVRQVYATLGHESEKFKRWLNAHLKQLVHAVGGFIQAGVQKKQLESLALLLSGLVKRSAFEANRTTEMRQSYKERLQSQERCTRVQIDFPILLGGNLQ